MIFTMSYFHAPPLINDLTGMKSTIDTKNHLSPEGGRAHTHVEYSAIIRAPLRVWYKRRKENQIRGWNENWEKDT